jgi:methanogenic corrinoid protein MtbC1
MKEIPETFIDLINKEQKEEVTLYFLKLLQEETYSISELYLNLLKPVMVEIDLLQKEKNFSIWEEHVRSNIIRTLIEISYPYVINEKKRNGIENKGDIVMICPEREYHELGALMVADLFTLNGWNVTYVGANTPKSEFILAINEVHPDFIAISVTSYYNLVHAKRTIDAIKDSLEKDVKIIVGGQAFKNDIKIANEVGGDYLLDSLTDIQSFVVEDTDETSV